MDDASVKPPCRSFSDATCQRLTQLLLRCVSLEDRSALPHWATEELELLRRADSSFADWCTKHVPLIANPLTAPVSGGNRLGCAAIVHDLPRQLVRVRDWQNREPVKSDLESQGTEPDALAEMHAATARSAAILLDVANLAIRLHGFESQFTRELEARIQHSLYNFAYGLSHELNNPLANIATRAGVLAQAETSQQRLNLLHAIVDNAMRGCEMLGDLMLIARPPHLQRQPVPIVPFLEAFMEKGRKWVEPRGVTLELQMQPLPAQPQVQFDASAITEALWVLVRNGVEAMPLGGRLTICSSYRIDLVDDTRSAAWWVIEVEDEGAGLSPQALYHCFDPYYSGREAGRGLGVGLTKAQRLVALHHGRLTLANRTDRLGCRAIVELPITDSNSP